MKQILIIIYIFSYGTLYAQVNDDFTDGNLTDSPVWIGSNAGADFVISDNKLRSNSNTANTTFFLSTASTLSTATQWEFWVNLQFSTSGANYADIYVISDKEDLKATSINGYFIRIGNTDDEISLYKRSGATGNSIKIIDGLNGSVGSSSNTIKIRLKRNSGGLFTLEREVVTSGSSYFTEGTAIDLTHTTATHFGIFIQQSTTSFFFKHFFDNIKIEPIIVDTNPPVLSSVSSIDSNTLELLFSEAMDSLTVKTISSFSISNNAGPVLKVLTTADPSKFILKLVNALSSGTYNVSVLNVKDRNGNLIGSNNSKLFNYIQPYVAKFGDIVINEIFSDPTPQIDLPSVEFAELRNNTSHSVSLKNWKFSDSGIISNLNEITIDPQSFVILCAKSDTAEYKLSGKVLGISPWPSLNNSGELLKLLSAENLIIDSVKYSDTWYRSSIKKQGGWTLERKDPKSKCEGLFNWFASLDTAGGTPGKQNSIYVAGSDLLPLYADSLKHLSDTSIRLSFSKPLNSSTLVSENFSLLPATSAIKKIILDAELKEVTVIYGTKFQAGTDYQMLISKVRDCSGSLISNIQDKLRFKINKPLVPASERADTAKIFITEIFADPSPEVNLPLVEFIEIYNPSRDTVNLEKWTINDPTSKATIPAKKMLPQEYIILCPLADTIHYKGSGKVIGLSQWPSLNNSSDQITLKSFKNRLVDSIAYSDTLYHSNSKKSGGWSIEKIDLKSVCENYFNWTASVDTNGGTPGKRNSVYRAGYDQLELKADSLKLLSDTTVKIWFNKHLNATTLQLDNFKLSPATSIVKKLISDPDFKEVVMTYDRRLQPDTDYQMSIFNVKDCSGNSMVNLQPIKFKTNKPALEKIDTAKIIISEIFADPSPENGLPLAEFIEIFNPGSAAVDLTQWTLNDAGTKSFIPGRNIGPGEYVILCPAADTLSFKQFGKAIGLAPWPSLGNSNDQIILKSFRQRLVDSITYSDKWYKNHVKRNGGWSLEKIDLLNNSCNGFYNWTSSTSPSGGTPGRINSKNRSGNISREIGIDSIRYTSDSTITLKLSSIADTSYLKPTAFIINNGIGRAKSLSFAVDYQQINLKFITKFQEGINYLLTVDSLFKCTGQRVKEPFNQASFIIPIVPELEYPIVINEIFADPFPPVGLPEIEFVEFYNPTEKPIKLKGMIYGVETNEYKFTSGEIAPDSYLILCPEKDTLNFIKFGKVLGLRSWPSLGNEKDVLFLKNNKGREFQKVSYSSSWYKDNDKKAGGYSLEMLSPASICVGFQNWHASKDPSGGTPGRKNSVYSNSPPEPLKLLDAVLTDSVTLLLSFNHTIDSMSTLALSNFILNNGIGEPAFVVPLSPDFDKIILKFKEPPGKGHTYKINVKNIRDCTGSAISNEFNHAEFILTESILKSDILVSEILFNPRPEGVDFVEIYNNAKHDLDLQELSIATIIKDTLSNTKRINSKQLLIRPGEYMAITTNPDNIRKEYVIENPNQILKITSLPAFSDDLGMVVLLSNNVIIDKLNYNEKMHFQLLKNFEGVSLERSSFKLNANASGNFRSATAAAGFATPGYKNSQYSIDPTGNKEFALTSKTFSPDNDGFEDLLQVSYKIQIPGMIANVKIFNDEGVLIKNLLKNSTLNAQGVFTWDGLNEYNVSPGAGIYIIYVEIFDINGNVKRFRKSFALATKL